MIKNNKWKLLISSIVILLPIVFGLVFWNELPEQMTTHWGFDGEVDGWSNRYFAVFALPIFILFIHWLCIFFTSIDPKNKNQNNEIFSIVIWITPIVSLVTNGAVYTVSLGKEFSPYLITTLLIGLTFVVIGNYLPKCKQNYTIGIKIPWTLNSEENWNRTHRFAGRLWTVCGIAIILTGFFGGFWIFFGVALLMVIAPIVYSYLLHRKGI